ncbi:dipeptidase [Robertmurraya andreesenii]|uniref:Acetylornithine deacetylase/succinyl-diaminopimelate desuccinylase-like protein n=1 Tax=Anoxybacillus andreesenii TaxID=1325932 RepID=A0ABT9V1C5_9BACL|nr:dipeptidase [Robertmurraya andreesenii]MDQ0154747.1 acetylornithine deacetylase/succinyl-diaminopimelate desuccinylase-like protein [Robertmurraya andreesenii]
MKPVFQNYLEEHREKHLGELFELLSLPSVSSLSEHKDDTQRAAEWVAHSLRQLGMENVALYPTAGHPVVYGEWLKAEGKPTVLIYGHYDVQPVDPLHLWETDPFEPQIRNEAIYARGSSDDKGQVFMHIKALEAILQTTGTLPFNFKFLIEGEEEVGSPNLPAFVEEYRELLKADVIMISDTSMLDEDRPTVCYGVRGLAGFQLDVKGPKRDLHSGLYGGAVQNPIHALVEILQSFRNEAGVITVDGFYDRVVPVTDEERAAFQSLNMTEESLKEEVGVKELFGEQGYSHLERTWVRPTLEINGIYGGFEGEGIKTVLPSEAHAKITCRLVPDQDPEEILELLQEHVKKNTPPGVEVNITLFDKGTPYVTPFEHPAIQAAGRAYEKVFGVPTAFTRGGGSLPIITTLDEVLKAPIVLMGFGLPTDQVHSPNEHFKLKNYDKGLLTICHYWYELEEAMK